MAGTICLIFGRRSGTSSLAKSLHERGYPLRGPLDTRELRTNPDGHYECLEARHMNGGMMRHFRINDKYPGMTPFLIHQGLETWLADHEAPFVVKEPRLCMTWPAWFRTAEACGRQLVSIWCRRPVEGQIRSLETAYEYERRDAELCVTMYEHCVDLASRMMPTLELWIEPDGSIRWLRSLLREWRAARWLERHGILTNQGEYHARNEESNQEGGGSTEAEENDDTGETRDRPAAVDGPGEPARTGAEPV